jgi:RNA polymerase sigma-70 factor (ECF subfamily)
MMGVSLPRPALDAEPCSNGAGSESLEDLALQLQHGDGQALGALALALRPRLLRLARDLLGDDHLAEDVTQESLVLVAERIHAYDPTRPFLPWVLTLTTRQALDQHRARRRRQSLLRRLGQAGRAGACPSSSQELHRRELRQLLDDLLQELSPRQRAAFVLRDLQSCSIGEVAATLGCSEGTVKAHLARARCRVRERLVRRHPEFAEDPVP